MLNHVTACRALCTLEHRTAVNATAATRLDDTEQALGVIRRAQETRQKSVVEPWLTRSFALTCVSSIICNNSLDRISELSLFISVSSHKIYS